MPSRLGTDTWSALTVGYRHQCAIRATDSTLWCWGTNTSGDLGNGTLTTAQLTPTKVGTGANWGKVKAGYQTTCAITGGASNTLSCFGAYAGDGTSVAKTTPTPVGTMADYVQTSSGVSHTCARRAGNSLYCWGGNSNGEVGDGTWVEKTAPTLIAGTWTWVSTGDNHTCGIKSDGTLWCWGRNMSGQLGIGSTTGSLSPAQVGTATNWSMVRGGSLHTCAIATDHTLWCWGDNSYGELGNGALGGDVTSPVQIGADTDWADVEASQYYTCARKTGGILWCWGSVSGNNMAISSTVSRSFPVPVTE